jgi:hypothetical protein
VPTEIELFYREACRLRGISEDVGVRVANSEGGLTEPARLGDFSGPPWHSGKSWWALQLHYGGAGTPYAAWGGSAGMGNSFTAVSRWQPGDPAAWRDAIRYGLNRARTGGWGPWYGAAALGITGHMGIDRQVPWDPNAELWDFETGQAPAAPRVVYTPSEPPHAQEHDWDCSQESAEWALWSVGRKPSDDWLESQMIAEGVVSPEQGLLDSTGAGLAAFLNRHYGEYGYQAHNVGSVTFAQLAESCGRYPLMIGGRTWYHWSGLRAYDAGRDVLLLANPGAGWKGINQEMTSAQFSALGPFSCVHLTHPDLTTVITDPSPIPPPIPVPPPADALTRRIAQLEQQVHDLTTAVAVLGDDIPDGHQALVDRARAIRAQFIGPRPES